MEYLLGQCRGDQGRGRGRARSTRGGELQELTDLGNMAERDEPVRGLHDLLHVLFPDVPEPRTEGPLPSPSGLPKTSANVDRDG